MNVAVLGCGPAGLLAAHAAQLLSHRVDIYSRKVKSPLSGAQYVHDPIPQVAEGQPDGRLNYIKRGSRQGYALKVYGSEDAPCSWDNFPEGELPAWSMPSMYDKLWDKFTNKIHDTEVTSDVIVDLFPKYDKIISAMPLKALCHNKAHRFKGAQVYITPQAEVEQDNTIVYNGCAGDRWYRTSKIFGHGSTESTRPTEGAWAGIKPTWSNCTCWQEIIRVGRFGKWEKGVLVHHAFQEATYELTPEALREAKPPVEIERTEEGLCLGKFPEHIPNKFDSCVRCGRPC